MDMQRKLETLADANPARGIPPAVHRFPKTTGHRRISPTVRFKPKATQLGFGF